MEIKNKTDFVQDLSINQPVQCESSMVEIRLKARAIKVVYDKNIYNVDKTTILNKQKKAPHYLVYNKPEIKDEQGIVIQEATTEFDDWYNLLIKVEIEGVWTEVKLGDFIMDSITPRMLRESGL